MILSESGQWVTLLHFDWEWGIWLLCTVLLSVKAFAFSPVTDEMAVRNLLLALLAAALLVPYFKRSRRVKETFTE